MQSVLLASAITLVAAGYEPVATTPAVAETPAVAVEYYYADYDNVVVAASKSLWYTSALNNAAVTRTKQGSTGSWGQAVNLGVDAKAVYDLKGATFCGQKDAVTGKYSQLFVADAGDDETQGAVYGWTVSEDPENPAAIKLSNKWTVYDQKDAAVTDVECGPKDGLFIADKGNNAVYWVTNANLKQNGDQKPQYDAVIPADCGAAVAEVRSLNYNAETGQLAWTNNAAAVDAAAVPDASAGVFQYGAAAGVSPTEASCEAKECDAWSKDCSGDIEQIAAPEGNATAPQYWAVAQSWGQVQVSQGDANLYEAESKEVVAEVAKEVTYAQPTDKARNSALLVADQEAGVVSAVTQDGHVNQVAKVKDAYGVAYNQGLGWNGEDSASALALSAGAILAVLALLL